jgi:hypothetical protein
MKTIINFHIASIITIVCIPFFIMNVKKISGQAGNQFKVNQPVTILNRIDLSGNWMMKDFTRGIGYQK